MGCLILIIAAVLFFTGHPFIGIALFLIGLAIKE